jgi:hypothetical protein
MIDRFYAKPLSGEMSIEMRRRSHIFHELKVISALRTKLREKRLKLAAKKPQRKQAENKY